MYLLIISGFILCSCSEARTPDIPAGPYLGQKTPGTQPEVFAPGIVSTDAEEFGCTFSPDGKEFYFTRKTTAVHNSNNRMTILVSRWGNAGWSAPEKAPFCGDSLVGEPNFAPAGGFVLFGRLVEQPEGGAESRIVISERTTGGWEQARKLIPGMFASISTNNMIYYTDVSQGPAMGDIYRVAFRQGSLGNPEKLAPPINSPRQDAHPFISPSGNMLIFDSNRPGGYGDNDLYICFRNSDQTWRQPINLGPTINTAAYEALPYLSYDRRYLFFSRHNNIYWVDAGFLTELE